VQLKADRAAGYVRALAGALDALAPHSDHVPLAEALALLRALDPGVSGDLLLPAEVDPMEGMPALSWLQRARAEQKLSRSEPPSEAEIARFLERDPPLADRLRARRALALHLAEHPLLPTSRLEAVARRLGAARGGAALTLVHDRVAPEGWVRLRVDLSLPASALGSGAPIAVEPGGLVTAGEGVRHLLARHGALPLVALKGQVEAALGGAVTRVSRGRVGPFWFPGIPLPGDTPPEVRRGLVLHLTAEALARDIARSGHRDPLTAPPPGERPPEGFGTYRERRLACSAGLAEPLERWTRARGAALSPVPFGPRG
jgi:hypothetical protein